MSTAEIDTRFTERVVRRAVQNVREGGKPFACLVVRDGKVLVEATNQVAQSGDVTAHAEISAIRLAAEMGITDLSDTDVYVTAYPCPMCLGAEHYEDGNRLMTLDTFYDEYAKPVDERTLRAEQGPSEDATLPFREWAARQD
jgi:guanine deaminase